ncbi:immunoglobulin-like domain-containing protein [Alkalibacterium putridalgicola]|uniref:immunoglobulin-like domain-containing protein n=1 Tax=Alkalibacterium putridalgicola TaxID=426703 RepID=UPI0034CD19F7
MIRQILFFMTVMLLSGCSAMSEEPVPHNMISDEDVVEETIIFSFTDTNRFNKTDLDLGIPKLQLMNGTFRELNTDFSLKVEYYDDGWQEIDTIDYYVKNYPYSLQREENLTYSLFTDHFDQPLASGRYRITLDYALLNERDDQEEEYTIGAVFWLNN